MRKLSLSFLLLDHHQSGTQAFRNELCRSVSIGDWELGKTLWVHSTLNAFMSEDQGKLDSSRYDPQQVHKHLNTGKTLCSCKEFLGMLYPKAISFHTFSLWYSTFSSLFYTHSLFATSGYWMFFHQVSLLSLYSVTLFPSMPAISANLLSRRLFLCFSLPSITLMNSDGGSRVMAGAVSASASSPFWQIAPINLIYHYFPSSFNKFLWASPPLMTRWLRRGLAAVMAPSWPDYPLFRCSGCRSHAHMSTFVFFHKCSHQRQNRVSGGIMLTLAPVAVWTNA